MPQVKTETLRKFYKALYPDTTEQEREESLVNLEVALQDATHQLYLMKRAIAEFADEGFISLAKTDRVAFGMSSDTSGLRDESGRDTADAEA
jgi:hypothetical protein